MAVHSRTQTGSVTLAAPDTSTTATPLSYDPATSIVSISISHGIDRPNSSWVKVEKTNTTTLTFTRAGTLDDVVISWELFEFSAGVTVQDLTVPLALPATYAIDQRNLSKSFILHTIHGAGNNFTQSDGVMLRFNSAVEIEIVSLGAVHGACAIQVVEYDGCSVQTLAPSLTASTLTSTTATIPTAVDVDAAIVFGSMTHDSAAALGFDAGLWRAALTNTTTVTLDRYVGTSLTVAWNLFVVEFTDGSTVQSGLVTLTAAETDVVITAVETDRSTVFLGSVFAQFSTGRTDWTTDDCRIADVRTSLPSPTTARFTRELTSGDTGLFWQVVSFNDILPNIHLGVTYRNVAIP